MKIIDFVNKYLPFFLFCLFVLGFFVLLFPRYGGAFLDVIIECAEPWFVPIKDFFLKFIAP